MAFMRKVCYIPLKRMYFLCFFKVVPEKICAPHELIGVSLELLRCKEFL